MLNLPQQSHFLIYQTEDGLVKIDVRFEDESVWLTQQRMAELFQTSQQNISLHITNKLRGRRTPARGNSQGILVSSSGRPPTGSATSHPLQPRHDHLRWLPGQKPCCHSFPQMEKSSSRSTIWWSNICSLPKGRLLTQAHAHDRLDCQAGRLSYAQRRQHSHACRKYLS